MKPATKLAPPKPETTKAILMSASAIRPSPTVHYYKETRLVSLPRIGVVWEHIFECAKTGMRRRWGIEIVDGDVDFFDAEDAETPAASAPAGVTAKRAVSAEVN